MPMIEMSAWDACKLRAIAAAAPIEHNDYLTVLAECIEDVLDLPGITLPGPDGLPNETVPAGFFD